MKIQFADTFTDSLRTLIRHNTWWYKTYSLFRYDLPRFFKNVWKFRDALWNHYWFDHHGTLRFLEIGLTDISNNMETKGNEIEPSRSKKVQKMRRAVEIIQNYNNFHFIYAVLIQFESFKYVQNVLTYEPYIFNTFLY